jgi:BNR repeat-like domain
MKDTSLIYSVLAILVIGASSLFAESPEVNKHIVVYGKDGEFAGWPANHGMWNWGNEILVGLSTGTHKNLGLERHNIDREKPEHHVLARSMNGGASWVMEYPGSKGMLLNEGGMRHGIMPPGKKEASPKKIKEPINFTHPNFCMTMRFDKIHDGISRLYYSYDRGHNWKGPFLIPNFGQPGIMARSDYIVNGKNDCHVFLTCSKSNKKEGRVFCGRTTDGGLTWKFLSFVGPEPNGFSIMPSSVRFSPTKIVMTSRRREGLGEKKHRWIDTWASEDNGKSWEFLNNAVQDVGEGNPPSMLRLNDGRLCVTYGDRKAPFEMQTKFSNDEGKSWSKPFVLITNTGGRDMGYPKSLQRPDGKIVTTYYCYFKDSPYRKVMATIWNPGTP